MKATGSPLPHPGIIARYIELGGTDFTFGSDAHDTGRCYEGIEDAKALVRSLGGRWQCGFECHRKIRTEI